MNNSSDVFMTLACVAVFADGPTTIEGIGHARVKESDRITACAENLRRLGIAVDEGDDYLRIHPGQPAETTLPTYEDHRIAMAFSLIGTRVPVTLDEPTVVGQDVSRVLQLAGRSPARTCSSVKRPANGDRDRWPGRRRQVDGRQGGGLSVGVHVSRYRRHVPLHCARRSARWRRSWRDRRHGRDLARRGVFGSTVRM